MQINKQSYRPGWTHIFFKTALLKNRRISEPELVNSVSSISKPTNGEMVILFIYDL